MSNAKLAKRERIQNFLASVGSLSQPGIVEKARKELGYSTNTKGADIKRSLMKYKLRMPRHNRAGSGPMQWTVEQIINRSEFLFKSSLIRDFMKEKEFEMFVESYLKARRNKKLKTYAPQENDVKLYDLFQEGKMTLQQLVEHKNYTNMTEAYKLIGRVHAWKKSNNL